VTLWALFLLIATVESNQRPLVVHKQAVGFIQLTPVYVRECNRLGGKFTLRDRYSVTKSWQMFKLYNKNRTHAEDIARTHRSGPSKKYDKKATRYWAKICKLIKQRKQNGKSK